MNAQDCSRPWRRQSGVPTAVLHYRGQPSALFVMKVYSDLSTESKCLIDIVVKITMVTIVWIIMKKQKL